MSTRFFAVAVISFSLAVVAAACGSNGDSVFGGATDSGFDFDAGGAETGAFTTDSGGGTGGGSCTKLTCADLGINCGPAGDGCGGLIECGTCTGTQTCGGGGIPSVCGGSAGCVPKDCTALAVECGPAGDGCGGLIATCGSCGSPAICGGAGPSKCGGGLVTDAGVLLPDGGVCHGRTTCNPNECGPVADGCGGILTCSGCPTGTTCGGGGVASMCGAPSCTKVPDCATAGATCGYVADGCGGVLNCGGSTCATGYCGGGGPNKCGVGDAGVTCVNFCLNQNACTSATQKTILKGTVFAPNGTLPIPNALVYVPNGSKTYPYGVTAFVDGVSSTSTCDSCSVEASGTPLVKTNANPDGTFELDDVPADVDFPIVIQLGRWRRIVTIKAITHCTTYTATAAETSFPSIQGSVAGGNQMDNIPLIAISTGYIDGLECVFRKLGIDDTQFTNPSGTGRVRLYRDTESGGTSGARINTSTPTTQSALIDDVTHLEAYDGVIFACPGGPTDKTTDMRNRVLTYTSEGGRVFATHFNYTWLYDVASPAGNAFTSAWGSAVQWIPENSAYNANATSDTGLVSTTVESGVFDQWLGAAGVSALSATSPDQVTIKDPRYDAFTPIDSHAQAFITQFNPADPAPIFHFSFDTPYAAANQCGRVIFSGFHVSVGSSTHNVNFPNECDTNALTSQEKVLAYMVFDLTSCIPTPPPPKCKSLSCADQGIECGPAGDGCGNPLDCNPCPAGEVCQGAPAKCITPPCSASSCPSEESCGPIPNGCGGTVDCGPCPTGTTCGGGGPSLCGTTACTKTTCDAQNIHCGPAADGCGGLLDCGPCPTGETCGGGGTPGVCGAPNCTKRTCASANANCGPIADGCGGSIDCGTCPNGETCGGGGTANQCGGLTPR